MDIIGAIELALLAPLLGVLAGAMYSHTLKAIAIATKTTKEAL